MINVARKKNHYAVVKYLLASQGVVIVERRPFAVNVPECPVCLEEIKPPTDIFNCRNGQLICGECMPNVVSCMCTTSSIVEYTG